MKASQCMLFTRTVTCSAVYLNGTRIPRANDVKYLGVHLDRKLNWKKHIISKRKHLGLKLSKIYWQKVTTVTRKQNTIIQNYTEIYLDIWYAIVGHGCKLQYRDTAKILQSKILKIITNAVRHKWYTPSRFQDTKLKKLSRNSAKNILTGKAFKQSRLQPYKNRKNSEKEKEETLLKRKRRTDLLNQYLMIKYFWITYSHDCKYACVLYKDVILVIYLLWYDYLDKCIAEWFR